MIMLSNNEEGDRLHIESNLHSDLNTKEGKKLERQSRAVKGSCKQRGQEREKEMKLKTTLVYL